MWSLVIYIVKIIIDFSQCIILICWYCSDIEGEESLKKRSESTEYQIDGCALLYCEKNKTNNTRQFENGHPNSYSGKKYFANSDIGQHISDIIANTLIDNQNFDNRILFEQQYFLDNCNNDIFMGSSSFLSGNMLDMHNNIPGRQSSSANHQAENLTDTEMREPISAGHYRLGPIRDDVNISSSNEDMPITHPTDKNVWLRNACDVVDDEPIRNY